MPQERHNPFPYPIASEVEAAPGTREEKAARNVVSRHITGIPKRGYLLGECDTAPIIQGVRDLTTVAYRLTDLLNIIEIDDSDCAREIGKLRCDLLKIMEDHGCPAERHFKESSE